MTDKSNSTITKTSIPGVVIIKRPIFSDNRGFFHEIFRANELSEVTGIDFKPVQWSHAMSKPKVIRAIHTENWNKLIYPVTGVLFAPIVDVRPDSETFGKIEEITIDNTKKDTERGAVFLPAGIGNSVCVKGTKDLHYIYLVDEYWDDAKAAGFAWDDPDININWPIKDPIISERDRKNPTLREKYPEKFKSKK